MVNEFPFGTSQSGKRDYLFRISICPGNFPVGRTKKTFIIYIPTGISENLWYMVNNLCHQIHQKHVLNMRSSFWASINDLHLNKEAEHGMLIIGSSFGKVHVSCKKRSLQFSLVECHPDLVLVSLHAWAPDTQTTSERAVSLSQQASRDLNRKDLLQKDQVIFWLWSLRFLVYNQAASNVFPHFH